MITTAKQCHHILCVVGRKRRASESLAESSEESTAAKRRRTFSEGEKPKLLRQHITQATESTTVSSDVKTDGNASGSVKTDGTSELAKRVTDGEQVPSRKDRKRKRTSVQSASEQEAELAAKADDNIAGMSCQGAADENGLTSKLCKASKDTSQCSSENVNPSVKKQKHVAKLKKEKKSKSKQKPEPPRLRVISKLVAICDMLL